MTFGNQVDVAQVRASVCDMSHERVLSIPGMHSQFPGSAAGEEAAAAVQGRRHQLVRPFPVEFDTGHAASGTGSGPPWHFPVPDAFVMACSYDNAEVYADGKVSGVNSCGIHLAV